MSHRVSNSCNIFPFFRFSPSSYISTRKQICFSENLVFFLLFLNAHPIVFPFAKGCTLSQFFLMLMYNHCQCLRSSSCAQLSWRPSAFGQIVFSAYLMFCGYLLALKNRSDLAIISAAPRLSLGKTDVQSLSVQHNECDEAFFLFDVRNDLVFLYCFSNEFLLIHKNNDTKYLSSPVTYANLPFPSTSSANMFHYIG